MMKSFSPGPDEADLAAGQVLDRAWVFSKLPRLLSQRGVLALQLGNRRGQVARLLIGPQDRREAPLTDQGVRDEHRGHEHQEIPRRTGLCAGATRNRGLLFQGISFTSWHAPTEYQTFLKSTS